MNKRLQIPRLFLPIIERERKGSITRTVSPACNFEGINFFIYLLIAFVLRTDAKEISSLVKR